MDTADLQLFHHQVVAPGLDLLFSLGGPKRSNAADRMIIAIAQQESAATHRYQVLESGNAGPARGFWQFEKNGGVVGVMTHAATKHLARALCDALRIQWQSAAIWRSLEGNDALAAGFARLLLWSDPSALPTPLDVSADAAWAYYLKLWRPGKAKPASWPKYWTASGAALQCPT